MLLRKLVDGGWLQTDYTIPCFMLAVGIGTIVNDGVEVGSHKGVKAKLGQYYIVTGKMSVDHSKFLAQMETLRDKADYNIMFVASEEDVLPNIPLAESFIKEIEKMISE